MIDVVALTGIIIAGLIGLYGLCRERYGLTVWFLLVPVIGISMSVRQSHHLHNACHRAGGSVVHIQGSDGGNICVVNGKVVDV